MNLLNTAYELIDKGFCVIATGDNKRAFLSWQHLQNEIITKQEAEAQFSNPKAAALAIITGKSSGNLEVIDIDTKYDLTGDLFDRYTQSIKDNDEELFAKLPIIRTKSGGFHLYYRCEVIEGNQKLARRHSSDQEKAKDPHDKVKVLIETRGQAGYVLAPPSEGYAVVQERECPTITVSERELILELARSFNEIIEEPIKPHKSSSHNPQEYGLSPFDDYNQRGDVVGMLESHGWKVVGSNSQKVMLRRPGRDEGASGNYNLDKRWFSVFSTSTIFEPQKAYLPYAVYCMLECNGDFVACAKKLLENGYGEKRTYFGDKVEKELFEKKQQGMNAEQMATHIVQSHGKTIAEAQTMVDKLNNVWGDTLLTFWNVDMKSGRMTLSPPKLANFLHAEGGFSLYFYDPGSTIFRLVRTVDGIVRASSTEKVKKYIKEYIRNLPERFDGGKTSGELMELVMKANNTLFSENSLEWMDHFSEEFLKDDADHAYYPYKNGVVVVTKDDVQLKTLAEIGKVIWESQELQREILIDQDARNSDFAEFTWLISGQDEKRHQFATTMIGYLIHKYKDPSRPYAIILAEENEDENKGGATGKGLLMQCVNKIVKVATLDGKNFKLDKSFAFQRVDLDTKIVFIDDALKNINFEYFYSLISEGMTIEKKNKDELYVPYEDSPKFVFATNFAIAGIADHSQRRQVTFEYANYFSKDKQPVDHFGHMFFKDWDRDEWNRFDNFMFMCVQEYMNLGIKRVTVSDKVVRKNIRLKYTDQFYDWWMDYLSSKAKEWRPFTELYNSFLLENDFDKKDYSQIRFAKAIHDCAILMGYEQEDRRNAQAANRIKEYKIDFKGKAVASRVEEVVDLSPF